MARRDHYQHLKTRRGTSCCGTDNPFCMQHAIPAELSKVEIIPITVDGVATTKTITRWYPNPAWKQHAGNQCPLCNGYYAGKVNEERHKDEEYKKKARLVSSANLPKDFYLNKTPWRKPGERPRQAQMER